MSKKSSTFALAFRKLIFLTFFGNVNIRRDLAARSRAEVARQAHNLKVGGSIPSSATT